APGQATLDIQRVEVDIGVAEIGTATINLHGLIERASCISADTAILRIDAVGQRRIYGIAGWGLAATEGINNLSGGRIRRREGAANAKSGKRRRVSSGIAEQYVVSAIVGHAEATANHGTVVESRRAPRETKARRKVVAVRLDKCIDKTDIACRH